MTALENPCGSSTLIWMNFGAPDPELLPGARNAVETCLGVRAGEQVALIADEASRAVAASISAALDDRKARCTGLLLEELAPRPMAAAEPTLQAEDLCSALCGRRARRKCWRPPRGSLRRRSARLAHPRGHPSTFPPRCAR